MPSWRSPAKIRRIAVALTVGENDLVLENGPAEIQLGRALQVVHILGVQRLSAKSSGELNSFDCPPIQPRDNSSLLVASGRAIRSIIPSARVSGIHIALFPGRSITAVARAGIDVTALAGLSGSLAAASRLRWAAWRIGIRRIGRSGRRRWSRWSRWSRRSAGGYN